jgi:hypothetical protein
MKKKAKRYQEGGEAEEKRRGLKASEGEKVGFLERIRMGNIDDPTSEAYKRLGAGRGRATASPDMTPYSETEDAKNLMKAAARESQGARAMADTDVSGMERYASEMGRGQMRAAPAPVRRTPRAAPETMAGDDELERAAAATAARMRDERTQYMQDQDAKAAARKAKEMADQRAKDTAPKKQKPGKFLNTGYKAFERIRQEGKERRAAAKENERKQGMKAGGMVKSGASKRADGIAQRGKTRGRIV